MGISQLAALALGCLALTAPLAKARAAQGRVLGMASMLSPVLGVEALASVLIQDGLNTSAIEGEMLNRLFDALETDGTPFEGGLNTRKYASLCSTSRATAYRELADLVAKGCLRATAMGGRSSVDALAV